jgi:hypothetical protein
MKYAKGDGPVVAEFAAGGPMVNTSRSRFMKVPDVFRTDIERTDYDKKSPGGEQSKTTGDSKSLPAIKPRA